MRSLFLLTVLLLALAGCNSAENNDVILARIDDEIITAEEFQLNYEFGHGHLRRGEDPRRAYLNFMIFERVLALEAEKINLDTSQAVIHAMHTLREELLIERVFEEKALSNVVVTEEEIRDEVVAAEHQDLVKMSPGPLPPPQAEADPARQPLPDGPELPNRVSQQSDHGVAATAVRATATN